MEKSPQLSKTTQGDVTTRKEGQLVVSQKQWKFPPTVVCLLSVEPTFDDVTPAWVVFEAVVIPPTVAWALSVVPTFSVVTPACVVSDAVEIPPTVVCLLSVEPTFAVVTADWVVLK